MEKIRRFFSLLTLYIIIFCVAGMFLSYLPELIKTTNFFGDKSCHECTNDMIDVGVKWGVRHYWYFWMCVIVSIVSIIRIGSWIFWFWEDNKKDYTKKVKGYPWR